MLTSPVLLLSRNKLSAAGLKSCLPEAYPAASVPVHSIERLIIDSGVGSIQQAGMLLLVDYDGLLYTYKLFDAGDGALKAACTLPLYQTDISQLKSKIIRRYLAPMVEKTSLAPVATLSIKRIRTDLYNDAGKLLMHADIMNVVQVRAEQNTAHYPKQYLELQPVPGYSEQTDEITNYMCGHCELRVVKMPDLLCQEALTRENTVAVTAAVKAALLLLLKELKKKRPDIIKDKNEEYLHKFRVAARRSRSLLESFESLFSSDFVDKGVKFYRQLGRKSNELRDYDVLIQNLEAYVDMLPDKDALILEPVIRNLLEKRYSAFQLFITYLEGPAYMKAWRHWNSSLKGIGEGGLTEQQKLAALDYTGQLLCDSFNTLEADIAHVNFDTPVELLHDLRKKAKKFRYLLELHCDMSAAAEYEVIMTGMRQFQDALGEYHDLMVHSSLIRRLLKQRRKQPELTMAAKNILVRLLDRMNKKAVEIRARFIAGEIDMFDRKFRQDIVALLCKDK